MDINVLVKVGYADEYRQPFSCLLPITVNWSNKHWMLLHPHFADRKDQPRMDD